MLSNEEQIHGLHELSNKVGTIHNINTVIKPGTDKGDVASVSAWHEMEGLGRTEICNASGNGMYDAWVDGNLKMSNITERKAMDILVYDYCILKSRVVAQRLLAEQSYDDKRTASRVALNATLQYHGLTRHPNNKKESNNG